ncbi:hypothetical protein AX154_004895 [Escherichia coli]|nr:hypothetical protein [Escherichia coli]EEQ3001319.1 hypothetical protein [Escherichia coli]EER2608037.1 hypothetical protein [Escherichia coli]EET4562110.1 hypothetical protein [Escherichia coli]EEY1392467.1 hypothetical protein [Escherichia coli]
MAITSAFQADDAGSIPATRSSESVKLFLGTALYWWDVYPNDLTRPVL